MIVSPWSVGAPLASVAATWVLVASFGAAVAVLESLDISLPRGDSIGVSGALNAAAIVIIGPAPAAIAALLGTSLALVIRRRGTAGWGGTSELLAVTVALFTASVVHLAALALMPTGLLGDYASVVAVSSMYLLAELTTAQVLVARGTSRSARRLIRGNIVRQAPLLVSQVSACLLTFIVFPHMGEWSLVLVVVLLLLIRQSYSLLLELQTTYMTTVGVLVEAAEGADGPRAGHGERTAELARQVGVGCGLSPTELEHISYAALLHDIDQLGGSAGSQTGAMRPSAVLDGVKGFGDVVEILRVFEGGEESQPTEQQLVAAYVIAISSDIDTRDCSGCGTIHGRPAVERLAQSVPPIVKARVAAAALRIGLQIPALP